MNSQQLAFQRDGDGFRPIRRADFREEDVQVLLDDGDADAQLTGGMQRERTRSDHTRGKGASPRRGTPSAPSARVTDAASGSAPFVSQSDIAVTTNKFSYVKQSHLLFCLKRRLLQPISDFQCLSHS